MYDIDAHKVLWKGKVIKTANAASFQRLSPIIGRDASSIYVVGKVAKVDAASFTILSKSYARDRDAVYLIMETKLKVVKHADPASFVAVGDCFGQDGAAAFFRATRMRLNKGCTPDRLRSFGHVYATDGISLFFGTERHAFPDQAHAAEPSLRLKWFSDNEVNLPILTLTDGHTCWVAIYHARQRWWECSGADFETLAPLAFDNGSLWHASYVADQTHVWFFGVPLDDVDPSTARMFGADMLRDGARLWHGTKPMAEKADDLAYLTHYATRSPEFLHGPLLHHGDRLVLHDLEDGPKTLATAHSDDARPVEQVITDSLREIFATMFAIFAHFPAIVCSPHDIMSKLDETPETFFKNNAVPAFEGKLNADGEIVLELPDGTALRQPLSAWYTLGCHLWSLSQQCAPSLLPYPPVGVMLPNSTAMHISLMKRHRSAFYRLIRAAHDAGHGAEARFLAHFSLFLTHKHRDPDLETLPDLVNLPRALMASFHYDQAHHTFEVTTNLAVSRLIIRDQWLEAEDFRDRIDVLDTLHGAILGTNKVALIFKDVIPAIMARYPREPLPAVREHLAMVLEAVLIRAQVDGEVANRFHYEAMLPVIAFCLSEGINVIFNRARLAETLWALGQDAEAQKVSEDLIADIGEAAHLPGVYSHRHIYRTPRLWFLRAKATIASRQGDLATHTARLAALDAEYEALIARYGAEASKWDEMADIKADIERYRDAVTKR